jgi:hypothetical protein
MFDAKMSQLIARWHRWYGRTFVVAPNGFELVVDPDPTAQHWLA